jgi:hypothetical protein
MPVIAGDEGAGSVVGSGGDKRHGIEPGDTGADLWQTA